MHSLKSEIEQLRAADLLDDASAQQLMAYEQGSTFSVFYELRLASYVAVLLLITGIGLLLKNNYDHIGPLTIAILIGLLAAACYWIALRLRRQSSEHSMVGDYVLLLGGLLVSADVGFIEVQFRWLGAHWALHLLVLTVFHAICAYAFDSRLLLSLALTTLGGWLGATHHVDDLFGYGYHRSDYGVRSFLLAGSALAWRMFNERHGKKPRFNDVLEHYTINAGFWAALIWCGNEPLWPGTFLAALLTAALAAWVIYLGKQRGSEWFVVYGVIYGAIGLCIVMARWINEPVLTIYLVLAMVMGATGLLWRTHQQFKESTP